MFERLIFPNLVEQEAARELLTSNWPECTLTNLGDAENFVLELHIHVHEKVFFKWAYNCQSRDNGVLIYCFNLSVQMLDPPTWMIEAMRELKDQRLLRE
jgi:hypothetical protein